MTPEEEALLARIEERLDRIDGLLAGMADEMEQTEVEPDCEPVDQFYGDRSGTLKDPFGHVWTLATHKEDLTEEELAQRFKDRMTQQ